MLVCRHRLSASVMGDVESTIGDCVALDPAVEALLDGACFAFFPFDDGWVSSKDALCFSRFADSGGGRTEDTEALRVEKEDGVVAKLLLDVVVIDCT